MLTELAKGNEGASAGFGGIQHSPEFTGAVFWLAKEGGQLLYLSAGYEAIWGRSCASLYATPESWLEAVHDEDRARVLDAISVRKARGESEVEFRVVRPDGGLRWVHSHSFQIRDAGGEVNRVAGVAQDITLRKKLEQEIIEVGDRELSRLGQDLHDGICQQLVSIAFAADLVRRDLAARSPAEAVRVARITALLDNAITQARNLSHTLCPVSLVGNGLGIALRELASSMSKGFRVVCEADCPEGIRINHHAVATHLYRIALEAVQNAIKHANANRILISLNQEGEAIQLTISDNGLAVDEASNRDFCVSMNLMRYRASMARFELEFHRDPFAGNVATCHCGREMP